MEKIKFNFSNDCNDRDKELIEESFAPPEGKQTDLKRVINCKCETANLVADVSPIGPLNTKFKLDVYCENDICVSGSKARTIDFFTN